MNDAEKKLAELEAEHRKQDEQGYRRDTEHAGTTQLALLRIRLIQLGLIDTEHPERAKGNWEFDPKTGQVRAWFVIDGFAHHLYEGEIYVEHKVKVAGELIYEWSFLDENAEPIEWMRGPPPGQGLS